MLIGSFRLSTFKAGGGGGFDGVTMLCINR